MKIETAKLLVEAAEKADTFSVEATLFPDYSGRAMYGRTTAGVTVYKMLDVALLAAVVVTVLHESGQEEKVDDFIHDLKNLRSDELGTGYIVY